MNNDTQVNDDLVKELRKVGHWWIITPKPENLYVITYQYKKKTCCLYTAAIIVSDDDLAPDIRQAIIWTSDAIVYRR